MTTDLRVTSVPVNRILELVGIKAPVCQLLEQSRVLIPIARAQDGPQSNLILVHKGTVGKLRVEGLGKGGEEHLGKLDTLFKGAFQNGVLTHSITITKEKIEKLGGRNIEQRLADTALGNSEGFRDETLYLYDPYLLQAVSNYDHQRKEFNTDVRVLKFIATKQNGDIEIEFIPFSADEIRKLQTNFAFRVEVDSKKSEECRLGFVDGTEELKTSLQVQNVTGKVGQSIDANINLLTNPQGVSISTNPASNVKTVQKGNEDLDTLRTLIENTFLNESERNYVDLQAKLAEFASIISIKDKKKNVEFSRESGPYRITVRGQVPVAQSVVLVLDIERVDGKEFLGNERKLLEEYSFQLHYRDPNTNSRLKNLKSEKVSLTSSAGKSENSMSCGFWPFYRTGQIRTNLYWDYHKGESKRVRYESGKVDRSQIKKNIVIELII